MADLVEDVLGDMCRVIKVVESQTLYWLTSKCCRFSVSKLPHSLDNIRCPGCKRRLILVRELNAGR